MVKSSRFGRGIICLREKMQNDQYLFSFSCYIASESTFYKVLKEAKQLTHRGWEQRKHKRPISTHKATRANQVWMWDITYLNGPIKGMHYYLYMFSDLYSRKIVGWEVWESEDAKHASELVKRIYRDEKIYIRNMQKEPLVLHSDNGSPMKGTTMLETLYALGITPSKSRPRVSNDNPYAESLFKTLKYVPNFQPQGFATLTKARLWVKRFVEWYNNEHRHSGINYVTPSQRLPVELAAKIAVHTVNRFLQDNPDCFDLVEWVLFDTHTESVYESEVDKIYNK